jgi:ParB-like chromosome segregation protein Spo0J
VGNGDLADNYPVPVLIVPADRALIASLSENCFHIPMHPADEFAAFAKLIGQGKSVEDVAAAFGVTPLVVKRRMKLATVSPKLMALFREDQIGLDCLMVLASVDDHQKQEQTWAALPSWNRRADYLRQLLTQGEIESDRDAVAKYVTVKAYEKAGGALRRDLFSDDDKKVYLLDAALLEKLATDKLQKRAKQIAAEGWKWVDVRVRYAFDEYVKYGELRKTKRQPDAEEAAALEGPGWSHRGAARADGSAGGSAGRRRRQRGDLLSARRRSRRPGGAAQGARRGPQRVAGRPDGPGRLRRPCRPQRRRRGEVRLDPPRRSQRHGRRPPAKPVRKRGTGRTTGVACRRPRPARCIPRSWCVASPPTGSPPSRPNCSTAPMWRWPRSPHIWPQKLLLDGNRSLLLPLGERLRHQRDRQPSRNLRSAAEDMAASAAWAEASGRAPPPGPACCPKTGTLSCLGCSNRATPPWSVCSPS